MAVRQPAIDVDFKGHSASGSRLLASLVILLELDETARAKLLPKIKQIKRDVYQLLQNPRSP